MSVGSFPSLGDLRVVTLNVWGSHYPTEVGMARVEPGADLPEAWLRRRDALRAGLQPLTPDLVAFQEVLCREGYDQVVDLLGPGYHVWHHPVREADGSGNSIASRWPFGEVRDMDHHITDRVGRHLLTVAEIRTPEPVGPLLFVHPSAYQMPFELERQLEALTTARIVEDLVGIDCPHVVLAGDFNAAPDTASMRFWRGRQTLDGTGACYVDAWDDVHRGQPGHTFTPGERDDESQWLATGAGPSHRLHLRALRAPGAHAAGHRVPAHLRRAGRRRVGQRPLRGCRRHGGAVLVMVVEPLPSAAPGTTLWTADLASTLVPITSVGR
jgi:endonuclease/exonuclease/phosphatase family metal-dependent hydrolase